MKAVIPEMPQYLLDERAAKGLDRWDEPKNEFAIQIVGDPAAREVLP